MDIKSLIFILLGSTFGLKLRFFLKDRLKKKRIYNLDYSAIANILASLFLGIFIALQPINKNFYLFFYIGFLGCLSTFSSFIYNVFDLIKKRKYLILFFYYLEVLLLSFLFFFVGYFILQIFKS